MRPTSWITPLLLMTAAAAVAATPAEAIKTRIAGFRSLGAAYKAVNDTLRAGEPRSPRLQEAATQILAAAQKQRQWFPAGSGPQAGIKTAARAEIWTKPAEFRAAQDALVLQATAFERVVKTGDEAQIRSGVRLLGAKCKACHDSFRTADDH